MNTSFQCKSDVYLLEFPSLAEVVRLSRIYLNRYAGVKGIVKLDLCHKVDYFVIEVDEGVVISNFHLRGFTRDQIHVSLIDFFNSGLRIQELVHGPRYWEFQGETEIKQYKQQIFIRLKYKYIDEIKLLNSGLPLT
jgi:hypothetical protein